MKIIGEGREGFILQATQSEVANMAGYYSHYTEGARDVLQVGAEIRVHAMYQQLQEFARMRSSLQGARHTLEAITKQLELVDPIIPAASIEREPKA